jgi:PadR family transcriptional regulator PadR
MQGTLDMLILRVLLFGPAHGQAIAKTIQRTSDDLLLIEQGSLYPALHRLEDREFIVGQWQTSDKGKRARYYSLTPHGRKRLIQEHSRWKQFARAIVMVMDQETK